MMLPGTQCVSGHGTGASRWSTSRAKSVREGAPARLHPSSEFTNDSKPGTNQEQTDLRKAPGQTFRMAGKFLDATDVGG